MVVQYKIEKRLFKVKDMVGRLYTVEAPLPAEENKVSTLPLFTWHIPQLFTQIKEYHNDVIV